LHTHPGAETGHRERKQGKGMTKIPWTHYTWNPFPGCTKVSAGCRYCYAEKMAYRLAGMGVRGYDQVLTDRKWNGCIVDRTVEAKRQLAAIKGPALVFVQSMGDLFHAAISDLQRDIIVGAMLGRPDLTFQILTKRIETAAAYYQSVADDQEECCEPNPLSDAPNIWMGASCENQEWARKRVPLLWQIPAAVRFLSVEPMLGPVLLDAGEVLEDDEDSGVGWGRCDAGNVAHQHDLFDDSLCVRTLDWVIVGAESGAQRRPCKLEWVRGIVAQCRAAGVPVFVKQLDLPGHTKVVKDIGQFPTDLQIQQWPAAVGV